MGVPFGFSVGDFISIGQLAWSVYEQCRKSPGQYGSLASEVLQLRNTLQNLQDLIEQRDLGAEKEAQLLERGQSCYELLAELENMVRKYESLGTQHRRAWDRVMWDQQGGRDMRTRLTSNNTLLSAFYNNITSSSQFRIEKALNQLIAENQAGHREGSTTSVGSICIASEADEDTWRQLVHDLEDIGISKKMVIEHQTFIKQWITGAVNGARLQETVPYEVGLPDTKPRNLGDVTSAEPSGPLPNGQLMPNHPVSDLELVTDRLTTSSLTTQAWLVAVDTLLSSHRQESCERDYRSDGCKKCLEKAMLLLEEGLEALQHSKTSEADQMPSLMALSNLGILYRDHRHYSPALEVLKKVCEGWDELMCPHAEEMLHASCVLAGVHESAGKNDEAESLYLHSLEAANFQLGSNADLTLRIMVATARFFLNAWKVQTAESLYQVAYNRSIHVSGPVSGFTAAIALQLGVCYGRQGKLNEAVATLSTAHAALLDTFGSNDPGTIASAKLLGNIYFKLQSYDRARDSWAIAISGHQVLGTLETPLGASLLHDCLTLGQHLGHADCYSWKIRRDPLEFMKKLGSDLEKGPTNVIGKSGQLKPPVTALPFLQRRFWDSHQDTGKQPLRADQIKAKREDDRTAAIASLSGTGLTESPEWSPRWLDSEDSDFSAQNMLHALREWSSPYPQGSPEVAHIASIRTLNFADVDPDGPPHQLVEAFREALLSVPEIQFKETNGAFRCMWNYCVVIDVHFVKVLITGVYGLQFRKRGSSMKLGDSYYGPWFKVWDEVLSRRVTTALQQMRGNSSQTRLEVVQGLLQDRLRKVSLLPPT